MSAKVKQFTAIIAVGLILAYLAMAAVPPMRNFVPVPATLGAVLLVAVICGAMLALVTEQAPQSIVVASLLAMLFFAGIRAYVVAWILGKFISFTFFELILSDSVLLYTMHRGLIMFLGCGLVGLIGAVAGVVAIPNRLRPY